MSQHVSYSATPSEAWSLTNNHYPQLVSYTEHMHHPNSDDQDKHSSSASAGPSYTVQSYDRRPTRTYGHGSTSLYEDYGHATSWSTPSPPVTQAFVSSPVVEAIPEPTPKIGYAAPVFQTFQDRKRAKDMALRAQGLGSKIPVVKDPTQMATHSGSAPYGMPPVQPARNASHLPPHPPPGPLSSTGRPVPTPPLRSMTPLGYSPSPSQSPSIPEMSLPGSSRPLPRPLPPAGTAALSSSTVPVAPSSFSTNRSDTAAPHTPIPHIASLERSDTISSIKSLDGSSFGRPLPKPPVGVNSSKSLDRGIPSSSIATDLWQRAPGRRQPSTVDEEEDDSVVDDVANFGRFGGGSTHISHSVSAEPARNNSSPNPIIAPPVPSISLPDDFVAGISSHRPNRAFENSTGRPPSPSFAISGLPVIAVSSEETTTGNTLPTLTLGNEAPALSRDASVIRSRLIPSSAILCACCGEAIIGRIVNAMNQRWHPQCFKCDECGELLEHVSSYEWQGKAYCHLDYHDKFAHRCHHCKTPIVDSRFVTLEDPMLGQRYYHELHFFCSECGDPFLDPSKSSAPGTEQSRDFDEDSETNAFVIHRGHPYCERCHLRLHKPKCKACLKPIPDIAVNAMGAKWHQECFVCSRCGGEFANNLFFPKDGLAHCTSCYEETL